MNNSNTVQYKQYEIQASPYIRINETPKWAIRFIVRKHMGDKILSSRFTYKEVLDTKEEAIQRCFSAGKVEIDKKSN